MKKQNCLIISSWNTAKYWLQGRIHFPKDNMGQTLRLDHNERWVIFREVIVDPVDPQPKVPGAVFRPRFHVRGMSLRQNILFSNLPIPFFIGLPGFRSKLWLYHQETGDFTGIYEWDSPQDAENYARSAAGKFMVNRSEPGSVTFQIFPGMSREVYLSSVLQAEEKPEKITVS